MKPTKRKPITYAKMQLYGGEPWGEVFLGERTSLYVCRYCRSEFHVGPEHEPSAYCDG